MKTYDDFLASKSQLDGNYGFEPVFTPFMGVGSEVYVPVLLGRKGIGCELKPSYYRQAVKNVTAAAAGQKFDVQNHDLFDEVAA